MAKALQSLPLYQQAKSLITQRIVDQFWRPGELLPSEFELASELGVSQGTVRKALDALAREGLVVRRQGMGTFVAAHDQQESLIKFFRLTTNEQERTDLPQSRIVDVVERDANEEERKLLHFESIHRVIQIHRVRDLHKRPVIVETIIAPVWLIRDLDEARELPGMAYHYYQQVRNVSIVRAVEKLRAVPATEDDAKLLEIPASTPLLEIARIATDLRGHGVERRISRCTTDEYFYLSELG